MMIWSLTILLLVVILNWRHKTKPGHPAILVDGGRGYVRSRPFRSSRFRQPQQK